MKQKPNLLFIFPDQLGAEYLGCYGNTFVNTPNIDRLAGQSLLFENCCTSFPLCTPYRASMLTGKYCSQIGIMKNNMKYPSEERSIADMFNDNGYHTCYIGKWHLAGLPAATRWVPPEHRAGFSEFIGWEAHHGLHIDQKIFDDDHPDEGMVMKGHETDGLTDIICSKLEELKQEDFCMFAAYQAPHPVCDPPEPFRQMYEDVDIPFKPTVSFDASFTGYSQIKGAITEQGPETFLRKYYGEVSHLDSAVGRIMSTLERCGLADNTVVVLTSDHGEMAGAHGGFGKNNMYEESIHVPLIIRMPGERTGQRTEALFSTVDFIDTFSSLFLLDPKEGSEGFDYSSLLLEGGSPEREYLFSETRASLGVRSKDFKLVTDRSGEHIEAFYSLQDDPDETDNRCTDEQYSAMINDMGNALLKWRAGIV